MALFDGVDIRIEAIAQYAGPNPPASLISTLSSIAADAKAARTAFDSGNDASAAQPIEDGLAAIQLFARAAWRHGLERFCAL